MKKIFTAGLFAVLLVGIIILLGKLVIVDFLTPLSRPLILFLFGKDYLVIPLTIVFTVLLIFIVGLLVSKIKLREILDKTLKRMAPKDIEIKRGALVRIGPNTHYIAAVIKETKLKRVNGIEKRYVLYCPSSPIPWGGLPIIFAKEEEVILLKMSYLELYSIAASFGENTPKLLEELSNQSTD